MNMIDQDIFPVKVALPTAMKSGLKDNVVFMLPTTTLELHFLPR